MPCCYVSCVMNLNAYLPVKQVMLIRLLYSNNRYKVAQNHSILENL